VGDRKGGGGGRDRRGPGGAGVLEESKGPLDFQDDEAASDAWTQDAFAGQDMNWTEAELDALKRWQSDEDYSVISEKLWKGEPLTAKERKMMVALDRALGKGFTPRDMVLYRGIDDWQTVLGSATKGSTFSKKNYAATTTVRSIANDFIYRDNGAVMKIRVPAGSKGAWIGGRVSDESDAGMKGEREFLLPRNSKFRITGYSRTPLGQRVIEVDLVRRKGK
jgi:hypothetical protein